VCDYTVIGIKLILDQQQDRPVCPNKRQTSSSSSLYCPERYNLKLSVHLTPFCVAWGLFGDFKKDKRMWQDEKIDSNLAERKSKWWDEFVLSKLLSFGIDQSLLKEKEWGEWWTFCGSNS